MGVRTRIAEAVGGREVADVGKLEDGIRSERVNNEIVHENLRRLEDAMEEEGWRRTTSTIEQEFTRGGLTDMIRISRAMYLLHPLIQRAVDVKTFYTWSQGCTMQAKEPKIQDAVVTPMMEDDANRSELYSHQARLLTDVDQQVDGNVFLALFTNDFGDVSVRSVPVEQITEILSREGDGKIITFYRRMWSEEVLSEYTGEAQTIQKEELYPDWRYHPRKKPDSFGGLKVNWDAPIMHNRTGGFKAMKFGVPETYAALEWARAYKGFLEDWHTLVKSLSRFAWKATTKGRKAKKVKEKLEKEGRGNGGEEAEEAEIPKPLGRKRIGDAAVLGKDEDLVPIPKTGATVSAEDARPSRLMVAAAFGMPDTILSGDVDVGNFATSKTLDRPTELMMMSQQILRAEREKDIFRYSVDAKVRALQLPGREVEDPRTDLWRIESTIDPTVDVTFPPILEHNVKETIESVIAAATLNGKSEAGTMPQDLVSKMLLEALGADNIDDLLKDLPERAFAEMPPEEREEIQEAIKSLTEAISSAA
jgi:hypothetical protein